MSVASPFAGHRRQPLSSVGRRADENVGVFGIPGLHRPEDFVMLAKSTAATVEMLVDEVASEGGVRGKGLLATFDEMSDQVPTCPQHGPRKIRGKVAWSLRCGLECLAGCG